MTKPLSQKPFDRPVGFILFDESTGTSTVHTFSLRPEDLTVTRPSRATVSQTLGGAWIDSFGAGVPTFTLSGHTGWRGDNDKDGLALFESLYHTCFKKWHDLRARLSAQGKDPNQISLIFIDALDGVNYVVAPTQFSLKRSKSRPLLAQYQISMSGVSETLAKPEPPAVTDKKAAINAFDRAANTVKSFAESIKGQIASVLGPIAKSVKGFLATARNVFGAVKSAIGAVTSTVSAIVAVAKDIAAIGKTVSQTIAAIKNIPSMIKGQFMKLKSAFNEIVCTMKKLFKGSAQPNYSDLYGASTCSSSSGGKPPSPLAGKNPIAAMVPAVKQGVSVTSAAAGAIKALKAVDPVLKPASLAGLGSALGAVSAGVSV